MQLSLAHQPESEELGTFLISAIIQPSLCFFLSTTLSNGAKSSLGQQISRSEHLTQLSFPFFLSIHRQRQLARSFSFNCIPCITSFPTTLQILKKVCQSFLKSVVPYRVVPMVNNHTWTWIGSCSSTHTGKPNWLSASHVSCLSLNKSHSSSCSCPIKALGAVGGLPERGHQGPCLHNSDGDHEPGRGAAGVAVVVPLAVDLSRQGLVGHMPDQPLRQAQPRLLQQRLAAQPPVALQDGLAEAIRPFVAHLGEKKRKKP